MNRQFVVLDSFHQECPAHFAHTVCVLVAQLDGNIQFHFQGEFFALGKLPQEHIVRQGAGLIGGRIVNQFRAVVDAHGQLLEEILHGGNSFRLGDFLAEGVAVLVVHLGFQVDIDVIAVAGLIFEGNGLGKLITGHHIFEIVK